MFSVDIKLQEFGINYIDIGTNICLNRSLDYRFTLQCRGESVYLERGIRSTAPFPTRTWTTSPNDLVISEANERDNPEFNPDFFASGNKVLFTPGLLTFPILEIFHRGLSLNTRIIGNATLPGGEYLHQDDIRRMVFDEILGNYTCQLENVYGSGAATTVISECSKYTRPLSLVSCPSFNRQTMRAGGNFVVCMQSFVVFLTIAGLHNDPTFM